MSSPEPPSTHLPSSTTAAAASPPSKFTISSSQASPSEDRYALTQVFPPMTTHWTKPQSCTWTYVADGGPQLASSGAVAWLDLEPIPGASTLSCYPGGMFFDGRTGVFSPATCPGGWTTVLLQVNTNEVSSLATTTAVRCSSNYDLDGSHCKRPVLTVLAVPITYNRTASTYEVMTNSTTTLYSATIAVNTIRALFMDQDKKLLDLSNESEISREEVPDQGLSLGARLGIAFGVGGFVLVCIGTVIFCVLRRRRSRRRQAKGRGPHELNFVHGSHLHAPAAYTPGDHGFDAHDQSAAEPPPAYEASTMTNSSVEPEGGDPDTREDEIRALVVQKAAIQRRLEELERTDAEDARGRVRSD
ncbi:hypothetical protein TOPH_00225 [Tolypocladium ophioglossoides CBS 100239]|uniref:Uncharacterized protein n=1 Tax=Tolypocladium ophioglossoides (strain CBS 100239) TaxID=1163406 RepID=A0A0L0NN92_TOLOC|nr:hypothetical protein TOPH_00225 [Tolypocladium ophioglossoides CBS 100239]